MKQLMNLARLSGFLGALALAGVACAQGQVIGWGLDQYGVPQPAMPSLLRYTEISAGVGTTYGLRSDGSVMKFGSGASGAGLIDSLGGVKHIAAGWYHAYALRSDGSLIGEGYSSDGQIATPANVGAVEQVVCGWNYTYAIRTDRTAIGWGRNDFGQTATPENLAPVLQIACGGYHTYAIQVDGSLVGWGSNAFGQINTPLGATQIKQVACGMYSAMALQTDGSVLGWGGGSSRLVPAGLVGVTQIAVGFDHAYALKGDGTAVGWGANQVGQVSTPSGLSGVVKLACGADHTIALKDDASVIAWGRNDTGQSSVPTGRDGVEAIACGWEHAYAVRTNGSVIGWGSNIYGQTNTPAGLAAVRQVSCGLAHTYAVKVDGTVVGWGGGLGSTGYSADCGQTNTPPGLNAVAQVACGAYHTYALKNGGTVVGWGGGVNSTDGWSADYGQTNTPAGLGGVSQIVCGAFHTVALKSDGTVVGWGSNNFGECNAPADAGGVTQVACGWYHTYALKSDGTLLGWGRGEYGQTTTPANLSGVTGVACGSGTTIALLSSQTSGCSNPGGAGTATVRVSGCSWQRAAAWNWSGGGGPQVPGALTNVDLGQYGSVGSECGASAATFVSRAGSSLLVPASASMVGNDYSVRVDSTATLAGRLWLLGVSGGGSTLPENLNIPVLSAGTVDGTFDLIQSEVPPPAGYFLTLVPSDVNGRTVLSLKLLPLPGNAELSGANAGTFSGTAVAAETIDLNHDGFDDLALAIDFGASQPGAVQVLLNDGTGVLGAISVLVNVASQPKCLTVGDLNADGLNDIAVGTASDGMVHVLLDNGSGGLAAGANIGPVGGTPNAVAVVPGPSSFMASANMLAVATSGNTMKFFTSGGALYQTISLAGAPTVAKAGNLDGSRGKGIATGGATSNSVDGLVASPTGFVQTILPDVGGMFQVSQTMYITAKPVAMDVADLDGDGLDDMVTANAEPQLPETGSALPVLSIFRNTNGSFGGGVPYQPSGASSGLSVSLLDVDNDGDRDIVSVYRKIGTQSEAALLRVDTLGAGTPISIGNTTVLDAANPILCARGNLDGTGGEDVVLVNQPSGNSFAADNQVKPFVSVGGFAQGDLDHDGAVGSGDIAVLLLNFGACSGCQSDLDRSGEVDSGDLALLLLMFG